MDRDLVRALRANGVDVITALEAGMVNRRDEDHLAFASAQGRVLLSYNARDYFRIHTELLTAGEPHAVIILAPQQRYSIGFNLHSAPRDSLGRLQGEVTWQRFRRLGASQPAAPVAPRP
jgi:hypothetical protein